MVNVRKNAMTEELNNFIDKVQKISMELYNEYNALGNGVEYTCELTDLIDKLYEFSLKKAMEVI